MRQVTAFYVGPRETELQAAFVGFFELLCRRMALPAPSLPKSLSIVTVRSKCHCFMCKTSFFSLTYARVQIFYTLLMHAEELELG